ncbi:MAG: hypothetical protein ACM3XZ_02760 [Betaproteobacteria bacterium]
MADRKAAPPAETYPRAELIKNAPALFGVMPEVVIGALHGNDKKELTVAEVKAAVKAFLERTVS